jgi:putative transposase
MKKKGRMNMTTTQIPSQLLDQLLKDYKRPEDLLGEQGILQQLSKALIERVLQSELTHHLGYEKHSPKGRNSGNSRNGRSAKTLKSKHGEINIEVPRDRRASFEPQFVPKHQRRFDGFDDKIISLYARGLTTREIQAHLEEIYSVEVSPELISQVTSAVLEEVRDWQSRPLEKLYAIVYLDALVVKVRVDGRVSNRSVYLAVGVNLEGKKEVLGLWGCETEGAKFWLSVVTELKNRGVEDVLIACVDGLKGFPEAIEAVYPQAQVQLCIVHLVRNSLRYVATKERKAVASWLKRIYTSATAEEAERQLEKFEWEWSEKYPSISRSWRANWARVVPMFSYPEEIRRAIYTTNAIESLNYTLRKVTKNRSLFPNEEAVYKLLYLALERVSKKWTMPIRNWSAALQQFAIVFEGRVTLP